MQLRRYQNKDLTELINLFKDTVHTINKMDYSSAQLNAWAPLLADFTSWQNSFLQNYTIIAEEASVICGFGDMRKDGYLDRLYIHKDRQREGIATRIVDNLEQYAASMCIKTITTDASITARPFFEKRSYHIIKQQSVERRGQKMTNYKMCKSLEYIIQANI